MCLIHRHEIMTANVIHLARLDKNITVFLSSLSAKGKLPNLLENRNWRSTKAEEVHSTVGTFDPAQAQQ